MKNYPLIILFLISTNTFGGMNVIQYQQMKSTEDIGWYLVGLGNGFDFSNTELQSLKERELYCLPPKSKLSEREIRGLVDSWISEQSISEILLIEIEPVLLSQLIKKYPCR
ncbi:hypothetical protein M2124_001513 [Polynucleobacter sphagniphilus]|nr:hypothetical protein [Polynucleobacter sphagniphilus]